MLLGNSRITLDEIHLYPVLLGEISRVKNMNLLTCMTRNLVRRSGSRLFSLDKIISNMSPWSFSMTTKTCSGVSNIHSRLTMPGWWSFCQAEEHVRSLLELFPLVTAGEGRMCSTWRIATSFLSWLSCLVGNLILSMILIATSLPLFLCLPAQRCLFKDLSISESVLFWIETGLSDISPP